MKPASSAAGYHDSTTSARRLGGISEPSLGERRVESKPFGWTARQVTALGMGTYYDPSWIMKSRMGVVGGADAKVAALRAGLDGGIRLIDTAEVYDSEPLVARAVEGLPREGLFIATKVMFIHLRHDALVKSLERSLRKLNLGYVDLYQVHQPSPFVPIRETMSAMEEMVDGGLIRYIGVSNFSLKQMVEANDSLKKYRLASTQMPYNLADREMEKEILPYCRKEDMALLAYFPLGHGRLASSGVLSSIGQKYGKTAPQVALNWLLSQENVFPIPRASTREHVMENMESAGWRMSAEDRSEIEKAYPPPV
jgi:diketogulonate reductase-like aldo/keto reductase